MHLDKHLNPAKLQALAEHIQAAKDDLLQGVTFDRNELTLVSRPNNIEDLLTFLRDDKTCQFKMLISVCGADYPEREDERFDVVYHLLSLTQNQRIRVKVPVAEGESVPSVCEIFSSANWYERETYDMFGIRFENHPDLRRLLTDYDFDGFPLRKDFPVEGRVEMFYDEEQRRCVYRPTNLKQDFRHFEWSSPWEGVGHATHLAEEDNLNAYDAKDFTAEGQK